MDWGCSSVSSTWFPGMPDCTGSLGNWHWPLWCAWLGRLAIFCQLAPLSDRVIRPKGDPRETRLKSISDLSASTEGEISSQQIRQYGNYRRVETETGRAKLEPRRIDNHFILISWTNKVPVFALDRQSHTASEYCPREHFCFCFGNNRSREPDIRECFLGICWSACAGLVPV